MSNSTHSRKSRKSGLVIAALVMSIVALVGAVVGIFSPVVERETRDIGFLAWEIGGVSDEGKLVESKERLYTEKLYSVEKMSIEITEDATVTYKVIFYDEDKEYTDMSDSLAEDFNVSSIPETAKFFRVVLTPNAVDGEVVKLNAFNMHKYAKQLIVKY